MLLRLFLPMLIGAIAAGAATYWAVARSSHAASADASFLETTQDAAAVGLESARAVSDIAACESALRRTAALPPSYARGVEVEALVARCGELDARRAVALVQALGLGRPTLVAAFRAWAERDAEAALAALRSVAGAADQRAVAAGLLEVLGVDDGAIERIAAAAPSANATSLRVEALALRAQRDPADAL